MDLYPLPDNPVPEGAVTGSILASDGVQLRFARWPATGRRTLGTISIFPGRGECIEKYFELIGDLRKRGLAVATLDWRGQGGSERRLRNPRKGHVDSFDEYDRDFDAFMQQVALPDCPPPHFGLAHSTGSLICLRAASDGRARFGRLVLASPLLGLGPGRPGQPTVHRVAAFLTAIGLGEMTVPRGRSKPIEVMGFAGNPLTSDPGRFARAVEIATERRDITIGAPTFGWLLAACKAMQQAADPAFGPSVRVPALIVAGSLDVVVSLRAIERLAGELRAGAQVVIPGARHELLMERDSLRQQFLAAFDAFIPGR